MKTIAIYILTVIVLCSCGNISGNGHTQTENRNVGNFNGVQTSGSMDIEVINGNQTSVLIEADDNILPYIITEVNDGLLDIYLKPNMSFSNIHSKIFVTAPGLKKLFVKGSGNITTTNTLKTTSFETKISGSGDINADIDVPEVKAEISGSGNLSLHGRCRSFEGSISGSGDIKCKNLLSENAAVSIAGSGTVHVYASVHLKASTAGSGDIYYSGNPSTEINKSGSGNVEPEK